MRGDVTRLRRMPGQRTGLTSPRRSRGLPQIPSPHVCAVHPTILIPSWRKSGMRRSHAERRFRNSAGGSSGCCRAAGTAQTAHPGTAGSVLSLPITLLWSAEFFRPEKLPSPMSPFLRPSRRMGHFRALSGRIMCMVCAQPPQPASSSGACFPRFIAFVHHPPVPAYNPRLPASWRTTPHPNQGEIFSHVPTSPTPVAPSHAAIHASLDPTIPTHSDRAQTHTRKDGGAGDRGGGGFDSGAMKGIGDVLRAAERVAAAGGQEV